MDTKVNIETELVKILDDLETQLEWEVQAAERRPEWYKPWPGETRAMMDLVQDMLIEEAKRGITAR
jgi:hypothetical protein